MSEPADQASQPVGGFFFAVGEKVMARAIDVGVIGATGAAAGGLLRAELMAEDGLIASV
jgi:hypothetical protein